MKWRMILAGCVLAVGGCSDDPAPVSVRLVGPTVTPGIVPVGGGDLVPERECLALGRVTIRDGDTILYADVPDSRSQRPTSCRYYLGDVDLRGAEFVTVEIGDVSDNFSAVPDDDGELVLDMARQLMLARIEKLQDD